MLSNLRKIYQIVVSNQHREFCTSLANFPWNIMAKFLFSQDSPLSYVTSLNQISGGGAGNWWKLTSCHDISRWKPVFVRIPLVAHIRKTFQTSLVPNLLDPITKSWQGLIDLRDSHDDRILSHSLCCLSPLVSMVVLHTVRSMATGSSGYLPLQPHIQRGREASLLALARTIPRKFSFSVEYNPSWTNHWGQEAMIAWMTQSGSWPHVIVVLDVIRKAVEGVQGRLLQWSLTGSQLDLLDMMMLLIRCHMINKALSHLSVDYIWTTDIFSRFLLKKKKRLILSVFLWGGCLQEKLGASCRSGGGNVDIVLCVTPEGHNG